MDVSWEFSVVLTYAGILVHVCIKMNEPSHDHVEHCMWHEEISYNFVSSSINGL